jgi:hypothetical protein
MVDKKRLGRPLSVSLSNSILSFAKAEIRAGAREIGGKNRGAFVAKYLEPSGLRPPQPWCAAFVSWCLLRATQKRELPAYPYFLSAREMFNWTRSCGFQTAAPKPGDLIFFHRGGLFSWKGHCGVVLSYSASKLVTIEGNRTTKVQTFQYDPMAIRNLLGYAGIIP